MSLFWPYDETTFQLADKARGAFKIITPWLVTEVEVKPGSLEYKALVDIASNRENPDPNYVPAVSKVLGQISHLPVAYQLPRKNLSFGSDEHKITSSLTYKSPQAMATALKLDKSKLFEEEWLWDHDAVLAFAACDEKSESPRLDPFSLLSIARRFHYLDCADDKISEVYEQVEDIDDPDKSREAAALIVRQNHYVTQKCQESVAPAVKLAQSQVGMVERFLDEEKGHDSILAGGLKAMDTDPESLKLTPAVVHLMQLLKACSETNFLAFCMALDFFERPQFKDRDSLAEVLTAVGETMASRALQAHKNINDHGEHEGFSLKLLQSMKPVQKDYAIQALGMAELVSGTIARVPHELEKLIFK